MSNPRADPDGEAVRVLFRALDSLFSTGSDATSFANKRALGELAAVVGSRYGQQYLAEAYTGWPDR